VTRRPRVPWPFQARRLQRCYTAPHGKWKKSPKLVAKLPPDQLARFRRWFTAFEAGRTNHAEELDSAATKFGRLAAARLLN
jgi:hypothetical protein